MDAINMIRKIKDFLSTHKLDFVLNTWHNFDYFWADYQYYQNKTVLAKYLLLPVTIAGWNTLRQEYDQFVRDIIEDVYYSLHNDLCWNLYLVVVVSDDDYQKIDYHTRYHFESNTEYTRNLIIKLSQLHKRLPIGQILLSSLSVSIESPVNDWLMTLGEYSFLLYDYSDVKFEKLQSKNLGSQRLPSLVDMESCTEIIQAIQTINIPKEFRSHFYQRDLNISFSQANLFVGANGAGKTSVLSAIELALTGSVLKQKEMTTDAADEADVSVILTVDANTKKESRPKTYDEKQRREMLWYNHNESHALNRLNSLFHSINYFSVDNTYRFVSSSASMGEILTKTLLGPETLSMWSNLKKYLTRCTEKIIELSAWYERLLAQLNQQTEFEEVYEADVRNYIRFSGLNIDPEMSIEQIRLIISKIEVELAQVAEFMPFGGPNETDLALADISQKIKSVQTRAIMLQDQAKKYYIEQKQLDEAIKDARDHFKSAEDKINALTPVQAMQGTLRFIAMNSSDISLIQSLQKQTKQAKNEIKRYDEFWEKFKSLRSCSEAPTSWELNNQLSRLREEEKQCSQSVKDLTGQIANKNREFEHQEKLMNRLYEAGRIAVANIPIRRCPLCDSPTNQRSILQHLQGKSDFSAELQSLNIQLDASEQTLKAIQKNIQAVQSKLSLINKIEFAFETALDEFPEYISDEGSALSIVHAILDERQRQAENIKSMENKISKLEKKILSASKKALRIQDLTEVLSAEDRVRYILLKNNYQTAAALPIDDLQKKAFEIIDDLTICAATQEEEIKFLEAHLKEIPLDAIAVEQRQVSLELEQLEREYKRQMRLKKFWQNLASLVSGDQQAMSSNCLQTQCGELKEMIEKLTAFNKFQQQKSKIEADITKTTEELEKYKLVVDKLKTLKAPEYYSNKYIKNNLHQISQIFLCLHSPQEFSGLEISEDGELFGLRDNRPVSIVNMSTGQRTALVLSVFFHLHLSNKVAPKILLIDEPLANIDDLNILSLIDFLREMVVIHNRQVFITTANRNIAQLFRRKFSFLENNFQKLDFLRKDNSNLQIVRQIYNQQHLINTDYLYE